MIKMCGCQTTKYLIKVFRESFLFFFFFFNFYAFVKESKLRSCQNLFENLTSRIDFGQCFWYHLKLNLA